MMFRGNSLLHCLPAIQVQRSRTCLGGTDPKQPRLIGSATIGVSVAVHGLELGSQLSSERGVQVKLGEPVAAYS